MEENTMLDDVSSNFEAIDLEKMGTAVYDQSNGLDISNVKAESFVVDVARLSRITTKELTANSKFNRSLSRKGLQPKSSERKTNPTNDNEKESKIVASPRATLGGLSMLEKPSVGQSDRAPAPTQAHHQITIKTIGGGGGSEGRSPVKRHNLRRSQHPWAFDPRKIFFVLATLSMVGTTLLIYFTLSISKPSGDDSSQNW